MMRTHETIFWVDSSIRMHTSNLETVYKRVTSTSRGVMMFIHSITNIFMVTHSGMYRYLPMTSESAIDVHEHGVAAIFMCRVKEVCSSNYIVNIQPNLDT